MIGYCKISIFGSISVSGLLLIIGHKLIIDMAVIWLFINRDRIKGNIYCAITDHLLSLILVRSLL